MANFDIDDPLGDLLSDGSDDSFFNDPKASAKRSTATKTPEKKRLFELDEPVKKDKDDWLGLGSEPVPAKRIEKKKISFEEADDSVKKIDQSKKASLMESIMGPQTKEFVSLDDLLKGSAKLKKTEAPPEVTQSTPHIPQALILDAPKEGRRGRPKSSGLPDPLGLFSDPTPPPKTEVEVIRAPSSTIVVDYEKPPSRRSSLTVKTPEVPKMEESSALLTQHKLATSNIEYQNTALVMQQQESQVLMSLQLKKYEDNLSEMQRKQQELLLSQEKHFNTLLDRQFARQQMMENNMRLQQERINNHIQMLIAQPSITPVAIESDEKLEELRKISNDERSKLYEEQIDNLKHRHKEEMLLLEESYKKQIQTQDQSFEVMESHLKTELDSIVQKHREKLDQADTEHAEQISKYKERIEQIRVAHESELKQMKDSNNRMLEDIRYEYNTVIENIRTSKQKEQNVMSDAQTYTEKLDASLKMLDVNSRGLLDVKERVDRDYNVLSAAREESLKAKEDEIRMMRTALEKAREMADNERAELMSLVRNLEIKLAEQSHNSREERFALQQAAATLTARTAASEREAEFSRNSLEREREQLQLLRESILREQEKSLNEITEEKLKLHVEKVRMETQDKLSYSYDSQRAKAEMEAAIQVAKEAAELTDRERNNLLKQVQDVESLKRKLADTEKKLQAREKELENSMELANRKNLAGDRALEEARFLQVNYNERLREIQCHMSTLTLRERKLAEEKIAISKERLNLRTSLKQIKKCSLCAVDSVPRLDVDLQMDEPVQEDLPIYDIHVTDADMFRLQLQMSEDQLTAVHNEDRFSNVPNEF